jgi:hypothetical protein
MFDQVVSDSIVRPPIITQTEYKKEGWYSRELRRFPLPLGRLFKLAFFTQPRTPFTDLLASLPHAFGLRLCTSYAAASRSGRRRSSVVCAGNVGHRALSALHGASDNTGRWRVVVAQCMTGKRESLRKAPYYITKHSLKGQEAHKK